MKICKKTSKKDWLFKIASTALLVISIIATKDKNDCKFPKI